MQGGGMHCKVASQAMIEVGDRSVCQIVVSSLIRSVFTLLKWSSHVYNLPIVFTNLLPFLALTQMVHFLPLFCSFQCFVSILFYATHRLSPVRLKCSKIARANAPKNTAPQNSLRHSIHLTFERGEWKKKRSAVLRCSISLLFRGPFVAVCAFVQTVRFGCQQHVYPQAVTASQPASLLTARTERPRINLCPRPNTTSAPIGRECIAQHSGWCLLYFISISLASNTASHRVPIHKHYHRGA